MQLIDASGEDFWVQMRKSLGKKRREMEEEHMDGDVKVKVMKVDSGDMRGVMDEILGHGSPKIGM